MARTDVPAIDTVFAALAAANESSGECLTLEALYGTVEDMHPDVDSLIGEAGVASALDHLVVDGRVRIHLGYGAIEGHPQVGALCAGVEPEQLDDVATVLAQLCGKACFHRDGSTAQAERTRYRAAALAALAYLDQE